MQFIWITNEPGNNIIKVVSVDEVVSWMAASDDKRDFGLVITSSALLEQVAVQRGSGVVDRIPVVVPV